MYENLIKPDAGEKMSTRLRKMANRQKSFKTSFANKK